ncbi:response regulator transcription factor [Gorillibacterium sp. CAU 1737]|uniref:response regulator transcription factor n=1 Tax=Gorillibacterium sp. CAU 1737 TaxID=3140362 RepID=UPI003260BCC3
MYRAILVDDEGFTRKGLMKLIDWEASGFQVVGEADNGEDALELIEQLRPDVVVTDIRMPELDGLELIGQVKERLTCSPHFIIVSGYDEFQYARQALRYGVEDFLLKPIHEQELLDALDRIRELLQKQKREEEREERMLPGALMEALILGDAEDRTLMGWAERLQWNVEEPLYYLFAERNDTEALFHREETEAIHPQEEPHAFKQRVEAALSRMADACRAFFLHEHRNRIGILLPSSSLRWYGGKVRTFAEELRRLLQAEAGSERIFIYAGTPAPGLRRLADSYQSAKQALLYKYQEERSGLVIAGEIPLPPLRYAPIGEERYREFLESVEERQAARLQQTIGDMFTSFQEEHYAPEAVKMAIHHCVLGIIRVIEDMEGDKNELPALHLILNWQDQNLTLGGLQRLFEQFAEESSLYLAELRSEQGKGSIHKIRAYIDAHYRENISLKSISAAFYLNSVYLGQLFKKTYGLYFNDYLLKLRITEAKRLLRQTDRRIYEIAELVGFSHADYFVTQFEKLEKQTPSEYRNRLTPYSGNRARKNHGA